MELERKIQLLEGVLAAVVNRALNEDRLPPAVVRLALADALHTVRELERQLEERRKAAAAADKTKRATKAACNAHAAADVTKEAQSNGEPDKT